MPRTVTPADLAIIAVKDADETVTALTTVQDDDDLFFPIGASTTEIWGFELFLIVLAANTAMDFKCGLSGPSGATAKWGAIGQGPGLAEVNGFGVRGPSGGPAGLAGTIGSTIAMATSGTGSTYMGYTLAGWIFGGGTAGNITFQWAQNTSDAGDLTLCKGSFLRATRLAV